jgi:hypothetical protein
MRTYVENRVAGKKARRPVAKKLRGDDTQAPACAL